VVADHTEQQRAQRTHQEPARVHAEGLWMRQADGIGASGGDFAAAVTAASTGILTLIICARLSCATKNSFPICLAKKAKTAKHTEHMHTAPTISRRAGGACGSVHFWARTGEIHPLEDASSDGRTQYSPQRDRIDL
jgi:hypothetical protein